MVSLYPCIQEAYRPTSAALSDRLYFHNCAPPRGLQAHQVVGSPRQKPAILRGPEWNYPCKEIGGSRRKGASPEPRRERTGAGSEGRVAWFVEPERLGFSPV